MKILIISTMTNNFGKKGMYNSQEIGLARGLTELGHIVHILKCVSSKEEEENLKLDDNLSITYKQCGYVGSNGFIRKGWLNDYTVFDIVIQFADCQLTVPKVYRWCRKNQVTYIPYVGVTYSQNNNRVIKFVIELLFIRNLRIYRKTGCIAKTPSVKNQLNKMGVKDVQLGYVCFDPGQAPVFFGERVNRQELRKQYGIGKERVLLFIGRFETDKRPADMVRILSQLTDHTTKLIMVGDGPLHAAAVKETTRLGLDDQVRFIKRIPNHDIWQIYSISDVLVNLNRSEIWGMVLLEAMYYQTPIIACSAPGPNTMIENGLSGYIAKSDEDVIRLLNSELPFERVKERASQRVGNLFNWRNTAQVFEEFSIHSKL